MSLAPMGRQHRGPACEHAVRSVVETIGGGFRLEECARCGLVSTAPFLSEEEVAPWYPPVYYGERNRRFNALLERLIPYFRGRRCTAIERRARKGRLVDVGCGRGLLPHLMRQRGWDASGVEISETAAVHAREVLGVPVHVGSVERAPFAPGSFDVVVFWHVLEHVPEPARALEKSHGILKPGGLLVIAVPNFDSLQARFSGRHWFHLDVPRHYHHFRASVLEHLVEQTGFSVESVHHFCLEQNPYGWIQSVLNRLGFRPNHLYDILKSESARTERHPVRRHPVQSLLTALLLVPLVPASLVLTVLESALRRGGTIELYAKKL